MKRRDSRKCVTPLLREPAEKSPGVFFANLKEDLLLQRQMHVLRRAENAVVHRLAIQQKVLFKSFQAKLYRSKLAYARLWGDKEAERHLRSRDLHVLNTNCGQEKDDFDFLQKLKRRPCTEVSSAGGRRTARPEDDVTDTTMEEVIKIVMREQALPETPTTLHALSTLGHLLHELQLLPDMQDNTLGIHSARTMVRRLGPSFTALRPATTPSADMQVADLPAGQQLHHLGRQQCGPLVTDRMHAEVQQDADRRGQERSQLAPSHVQLPGSPPHVHLSANRTLSPLPRSPVPAMQPPRSPVWRPGAGLSASRLESCRASSQPWNIFEEDKKEDVLALRLQEVQAENLSPKVKAFIRSLNELDTRCNHTLNSAGGQQDEDGASAEKKAELKGDSQFDYYATKMALYAASVQRVPLPTAPGTPEDINQRLVGNQTVRSLTMPRLRLDFDSDNNGDSVYDDILQLQPLTSMLSVITE